MGIDQNIKREAIRYLRCVGSEIDAVTNSQIDESIEELGKISKERSVLKTFAIGSDQSGLRLEGSSLILPGKDILRHLADSPKCILMAASLGCEVDSRIRYYEKISMTKALIFDACATAAIENYCDKLCDGLTEELNKADMTLTSRFSPGYGDLPLDIQKEFLATLNAAKSIGLSASSSSILIPRKSVTAIVGILSIDKRKEQKRCIECRLYSECNYRKEESDCGC